MYHHPAAPRKRETITTAMTFGFLIMSASVAASCRLLSTGVKTSSGSSSTASATRTASRTSSSSGGSSMDSGSSSSMEMVVSSSRERTTSSSSASSTGSGVDSASESPTSLRDKPASRRRSTNSAFFPDVARSLMTHRALSLATVSDDVSSVIRSPRLIRWLIPYQGWWSMRRH